MSIIQHPAYLPHANPYLTRQMGGFAVIPALTAAYGLARKYKPFSKAKGIIENNFGQHKNSLGYKIAHGVSSAGAALGMGEIPVGYPMPVRTVVRRRGKKPGPKKGRKRATKTRKVLVV